MAKALTKPQPTSSVNRFLKDTDFNAALGPIDEPEFKPTHEETAPATPPRISSSAAQVIPAPAPIRMPLRQPQRTETLEVIMSPDLSELVNTLRSMIHSSTGANLSKSQLMRSLLRAVKLNMRGIGREAERLGPLRRPSNNPGFEEERELFEDTCAQVFSRGMRG